jgi:mono/diheme cytochrome c family protein
MNDAHEAQRSARPTKRARRWAQRSTTVSLIALLFFALTGQSSPKLPLSLRAPATLTPGAGGLPDSPPLADLESKDAPGLTLRIEAAGGASGHALADLRVTRMLALYVPAGSAPSAFTAGPYKATFEGDISMRLRDFLFFSPRGRGKLNLTINGKPVLDLSGDFADKISESTRLNKGKNHLVAVYEPLPNTDGELRLFWATKTTLPEPVPPGVLSHHNGDRSLRQSLRVREGRLLVAQLRCTKCHIVDGLADGKAGMPELAMDAPSLEQAGWRLSPEWMAAWISNPRKLRPTAHMPRLLETNDAVAPGARDIAAYLFSLRTPDPLYAPEKGSAEAGGQLFVNLNCVACHISPERKGESQGGAEAGRISLAHVNGKFYSGALKVFLLNPSANYAWISMPNFRLSAQEAENLATYLRSAGAKAPDAAPNGNPAVGEQLFRTAGCVNCHSLGRNRPPPEKTKLPIAFDAISKEGWTHGCMSADAAGRKRAPDFSLTEAQRSALLAFAATDRLSLKQDTAAEFSQRQFVALRCAACHARDGHESLLATDLDAENQELRNKFPAPPISGGEGMAPDQRAPILTWAGEKLRPEWTAKFIAGKIPYKPRYYLRARMPGFVTQADLLARGLTEEHGCAPFYPPSGPPDKKLAEIGQMLAGKAPNQSFGCTQCHSINQQAALAPFEAPAINFMHVTSRLREDYYYRWIHDPLRVDPETKMPRFDDADGKTGVPVFDNDAKKQYEAIWNYLLTGNDIVPPAQ